MPSTKVKPVVTARLKQAYYQQYTDELMNELNLANRHQLPILEKVVINVGLGRAKDDKKAMETASNTLRKITGQQPVQTTAKKSIAGFKLREENKIGIKVTLRNERMYEFVDRLVNVVMPRLRDFHGVPPASFDKSGNYNFGIADQSVFPELSFEETSYIHGLQIVFVVKTGSIDHSKALLQKIGLPFQRSHVESAQKRGV